MRPEERRLAIASRTTERLTWYFSINTRSGGSRSPGVSSPLSMLDDKARRSWAVRLSRGRFSMEVVGIGAFSAAMQAATTIRVGGAPCKGQLVGYQNKVV